MKKIINLIALSILIVSFTACNKGEDISKWRDANIAAYDAITKNPNYKHLNTETGPTGIYYKVIESGTGTEKPFQTSKVKVRYKGTYYDGVVFDAGTGENGTPVEFSLVGNSLVRGFSFTLQRMVVGDKWEVWIPYYLGYGAAGYTTSSYYYPYSSYQTIIKGYTTLVFEIELVSINQYP